MGESREWISSLLKQCFVTTGVSLNMAAVGLITGYGTPLLNQLEMPDSYIPIDESLGSWIASLPAIFVFLGNLCVIPIMGKFGRRSANLTSIFLLIIAWISIVFSSSITVLLIGRALQGVSMGMGFILGPLLVGEYTSPRNRGAFLMTISISVALGVIFVHTVGSLMTWTKTAIVCSVVALIDLIIVIFSPESPSWLASQGRYEASQRAFRWLRGDTEEDELNKMIEASMAYIESKVLLTDKSDSIVVKLQRGCTYFNVTIRKAEFFKPLLIMIHLYTLGIWGGVGVLTVYPDYLFRKLIRNETNIPLVVFTLDLQRVLTNIIAIYIIKKFRRRVVLFTTIGVNTAFLLALAVYSYAKEYFALPFDHPMIAISLTHCVMFSIAMGSFSLLFIIAGEIFPLEFKSLSGGISVFFYSVNLFLSIKCLPFCLSNFGVHGTCGLAALLIGYCVAVVGFLLPETKDITLQEIEEQFRGRSQISKNLDEKSDTKCNTTF